MTLMRELTITIISPSDTEIFGTIGEILRALHGMHKETMIDIHICPAEEEKADE